jgi:hypothetical protein
MDQVDNSEIFFSIKDESEMPEEDQISVH